ncbi:MULTISPECIES: winged helix-turn-helix domain-containing protein [unclassified Arthrobacter]|uniref:winged helix-turn-helix domain-containing protein n=1 Tax=unclassified Arthrobacter TaxID=235627 RepID=UPI001487400C|nr:MULTISPECIES: winged helix-turn-helix domain-containing protein [unclassified Arthrobacter]
MSEKTGPEQAVDGGGSVLVAGPLTVDLERYEARLDGEEILFSQKELLLLAFLMQKGGRVASSEEISAALWGHPTTTNTVQVHIKRIRKKLGDESPMGLIRTVRGAGYRLSPTLCP